MARPSSCGRGGQRIAPRWIPFSQALRINPGICASCDRLVGVARFVRLPETPSIAEVAITVVDRHQGKGLGRLLLLQLMAIAPEHGVAAFRYYVSPENRAMLRLLRSYRPATAVDDKA